jgi:glyoxylase-like metal-dependent hydrolase (beta-lactamase superfamily II)
MMQVFEGLHAFLWESLISDNSNAYLIRGPTPVLIDPGHRQHLDHVLSGMEPLGLSIGDIGLVICTHAHPDHAEAVSLFRDKSSRVAMHEADWQMLRNFERTPGAELQAFTPDVFLQEGELNVDGMILRILHTPGHSPGSIAVYWPDKKALFPGDLVFREGVGRTDLPGGNGKDLKESIRRLMALEVEWMLPGHGEIISGEAEVADNFRQIEEFWFNYV